MSKPAEIAASIYHYLPASVHTRDIIMSGQPITSDLLVETMALSLGDGLNLALHHADASMISDVILKLEANQSAFIKNKLGTATDEEKDAFTVFAVGQDFAAPVLNAFLLLKKIELEIPILDLVEIKHELISEMGEIGKHQASEREIKMSKREIDVDNPIYDKINDAVAPFYPVLPMIKQLVSAYVLQNIKETGQSNLDVWQQRELERYDFTKEGLKNSFDISVHVVKHSDDFTHPSNALGFVGRQLKHFSPEERISLVSDTVSSVSGFSSEDLGSSGAVFYISMLKLSVENPGLREKALELADAFRQKFFTQPAARENFLKIFNGEVYGSLAPDAMVAAITTKEALEQDPAFAYEILSRINQLHPDFDVKQDPSKLLTLWIHKDFLSAPLAFYLAKDPNNEQIIRDSITNTWQLEVVDSVTASAPGIKKRREQENDTGFSM